MTGTVTEGRGRGSAADRTIALLPHSLPTTVDSTGYANAWPVTAAGRNRLVVNAEDYFAETGAEGLYTEASFAFRIAGTRPTSYGSCCSSRRHPSVPTRSLVNTAPAFLHDHLDAGVEQLAAALAERLIEACPAASTARGGVLEHPWTRVAGSRHAFTTNPSDRWTADAMAHRGQPTTVVSSISGLHRAASTGSGFTGFLVDDYTLAGQVTREDRALHLSGDMWWEYGSRPTDYDRCRSEALRAFMDSVTDQRSFSCQHSAYLSASAVLDACPDIDRVGVRARATITCRSTSPRSTGATKAASTSAPTPPTARARSPSREPYEPWRNP
ncbi:hypothetical protein ACFWAT_16290 [Streptomyces syringium]|uniref:hypothetical protein n=1 Tax=Streptomyces syringium TaxID=76729 RepID=UPI00366A18FB